MIDYSTKRKNKLKNEVKAYTLLGLPMGWWTLFFVVAFFSALFFSFTNVSLKKLATGAEIKFTLDNYKRIFCPDFAKFDKTFWDSMGVTVVWTLVMTLGNNLMGLVCAFLINSLKKGKRFFLALLFWPSLVSGVVGSDVTKMVFGSDNNSLANKIVMLFGGQPVQWLTDEQLALFSLMIMPFFLGFCLFTTRPSFPYRKPTKRLPRWTRPVSGRFFSK